MRIELPIAAGLVGALCLALALHAAHETTGPGALGAAEPARDSPVATLALCASGSEKADAIAALVEVELSRRDDVVLLDREHIDNVLAEHKLSLAGLLSPDDALKAGRLLGCDVLAELHYEAATQDNAGEVTSLVAIDALSGVRLVDAALPPHEELDGRARAAAEALALGLAKWQGGGTVPEGRTLSLVSVRQLNLPETSHNAGELLALFLERRFVNSPDVSILERKRLELIRKESELTALRRDRLLSSSVSLDIDVLTGQERGELTARVTLTDGAGDALGTVGASGSAEELDGLAAKLAAAILRKLKLHPPGETPVVPGLEANRFLADAVRLEIRGRKAEAALSEAAATMLAEAQLARTPWNVPVRKVVCRLLLRKAARASDPGESVALLERHVELSGRWTKAPDTQGITRSFGEVLHHTLRRIRQEAHKDRVRALRERFGQWCKRAAEHDPTCAGDFSIIEAWSTSVDQLLDDCGTYLDELPDRLGVVRYTAATEFGPGAGYLYLDSDFSPAHRRKLLALYERWGAPGGASQDVRLSLFRRMHSLVAAAMLVHDFPEGFGDGGDGVSNHLHRAAALALQDPSMAELFLELCEARGPRPPAHYRPLPREAITREALWLAVALESKHVASPLVAEYLDEHAADGADHPGAYLERAWEQLHSPDWTPPRGNVLGPRFPEWYAERLAAVYNARYGGQIATAGPGAVQPAESVRLSRLFEFENLPGVSSIESAELASDWVYLLCLHPNPRSYELRRVSVRSGKQEILGEAVGDFEYRARTGNDITVGRHAVYVPTSGGLICFSTRSTKTWTVTETDGLPACGVTACLEVDGKLYLGCRGREEGYLVRCNTDGTGIELLASSGRKEKRSGLDDCPPYTIDSMVYDAAGGRVFVAAMFLEPEAADRPWLWAYEPASGEIREVHRLPYHPIQLRKLPDGRLLFHLADVNHQRRVVKRLSDGSEVTVTLRAPSARGARGYGVFDPAGYRGEPLDDLREHVLPLIGNLDPERLRSRYEVPTFCGESHVLPGTTSSLALLGANWLISSGVRRSPLALPPDAEPRMTTAQAGYGRPWQLIPRDDLGEPVQAMPLLDGEAPFAVRLHDGRLVACTESGVWKVDLELPASREASCQLAQKPAESSIPSSSGKLAACPTGSQTTQGHSEGTAAGGLVVRAPNGSAVSINRGRAYRVWKDRRLTWNGLPVGRHTVRVGLSGSAVEKEVAIREGELATLDVPFDEPSTPRRVLALGPGCEMELIWVPERPATGQANGAWSIPEGFWMGKHEVTQDQYEAIMGSNPSFYVHPQHPVERVGRKEALAFCERLTGKCEAELGGLVFRLPSEDEWAFAHEPADEPLRAAWFPANSDGHSHPVGQKMPCPRWLYDIQGNVAEWCEHGQPRGGSWRSQGRSPSEATGFRVVLSTTDARRSVDPDGWTHLAYLDPDRVRVGYGSFRAYKRRDRNPRIAGGDRDAFETMLLVHAVSSVRYELGGKYREFQTFYARPRSAAGVARFAVFGDGQQKYRGPRVWSWRGTERSGLKEPVTIDVSGVEVLELVTYGDDNGSISGSFGLWVDPKVR